MIKNECLPHLYISYSVCMPHVPKKTSLDELNYLRKILYVKIYVQSSHVYTMLLSRVNWIYSINMYFTIIASIQYKFVSVAIEKLVMQKSSSTFPYY